MSKYLNADAATTAIGSAAANTTPWGAIAQGASSVVNNLVSNIFRSGIEKKKANAEIQLKQQQQKYNQSLSTLTNQQKYVLDMQLANAKTDTERMALIANAVAQINQTSVAANASAGYKTAMIVLGSSVVLIGGLYLLSKD